MTLRGKLVLAFLVVLLAGLGGYQWWDRLRPADLLARLPATVHVGSSSSAADDLKAALITPATSPNDLGTASAYVPKGDTIDIELSQYAGYSGFVVANGGFDPSEDSFFYKKYGFKVHFTLSEEESWPALNAGKMAASATTADVLAVYSHGFHVKVPALIGYSRGADGIVVRKDVHKINDLKGRVVVTSQFTEADFFLRYLAQEAGIDVAILADATQPPELDKINLVYASDAFAAGDLFLKDVLNGGNFLAGCVTWAPKTTDVVEASKGGANLLVTSKNLLVIADILVVNEGFASAHPDWVKGLVDGLLEGNHEINADPASKLDMIAKAFKWTKAQASDELAKVHLANLPENQAFFSGAIDAAGSFNEIYQSAALSYGPQFIKDPPDADKFTDLASLQALAASGAFAGEQIAIAPIKTTNKGSIEGEALLKKDIRFFFDPDSSKLDLTQASNSKSLEDIKRLLQVSPGSTILLVGHVDNSSIENFRQKGGEALVRKMALTAMELSKERANEIRNVMVDTLRVDKSRLETVGRGWEQPAGTDPDKNRRVEIQWFTIE